MATEVGAEYPVAQARAEFSDLVNRVHYTGKPVTVTKRGRPIVRIVPAGGHVEEEEDT